MVTTLEKIKKFKKGMARWLREDHTLAVRIAWRIVPPALIALAVAGFYLQEWQSLREFSRALDRRYPLFQDFLAHYYPMSRSIFTANAPEPGYFYSSFFAILLHPLGTLDAPSATLAWGVVQCVLVAVLFILPLVNLIPRRPLLLSVYTTAFLTSSPILHNVKWGQVSVLLTACILGSFTAYKANWRILAGILVGFAAAIKYYPAIFILYFISRRDLKACASAIAATVVFYAIIPAVLMGPVRWVEFESTTIRAIPSGELIFNNINSQYFSHVVARWMSIVTVSPDPALTDILHRIGQAVVFSNIIMIWVINTRIPQGRRALSLATLLISLPFFIETSWSHYLCYLPFCQTLLLSHCIYCGPSQNWSKILLSTLPLSSIVCSSAIALSAFDSWRPYALYGLPFVANLLLLICLYILVAVKPTRPWKIPIAPA